MFSAQRPQVPKHRCSMHGSSISVYSRFGHGRFLVINSMTYLLCSYCVRLTTTRSHCLLLACPQLLRRSCSGSASALCCADCRCMCIAAVLRCFPSSNLQFLRFCDCLLYGFKLGLPAPDMRWLRPCTSFRQWAPPFENR